MEQLEEPLKTTFQVPICSTRCSWWISAFFLVLPSWFWLLSERKPLPLVLILFSMRFWSRLLLQFLFIWCCWALLFCILLKNCYSVCCPVSRVKVRSLEFHRVAHFGQFSVVHFRIFIKMKFSQSLISLFPASITL
jgi:hypothetical protein